MFGNLSLEVADQSAPIRDGWLWTSEHGATFLKTVLLKRKTQAQSAITCLPGC
jgi:hypothetical protein